jgi:DNA-directed RNA polymerase subunit RPC12/RpoP
MSHHEASEHPDHPASTEGSKTCRVCTSSYSHDENPSWLGICEKCGYKILIGLVVVMVVISYAVWMGIF